MSDHENTSEDWEWFLQTDRNILNKMPQGIPLTEYEWKTFRTILNRIITILKEDLEEEKDDDRRTALIERRTALLAIKQKLPSQYAAPLTSYEWDTFKIFMTLEVKRDERELKLAQASEGAKEEKEKGPNLSLIKPAEEGDDKDNES